MITPGYRNNFATLQRATHDQRLCAVQSTRKADQASVVLICAVNPDGGLAPLAEMISGNPYELYEDPTK